MTEKKHTPVPIRCEQTGDIFSSIKQAVYALGLSASTMALHLSSRDKCRHVSGYTFVRLEGAKPFEPQPMVTGPRRRGVSRPVRCNETGTEYPTLTAAARDLNLKISSLCEHISGDPRRPRVGGYTFTDI